MVLKEILRLSDGRPLPGLSGPSVRTQTPWDISESAPTLADYEGWKSGSKSIRASGYFDVAELKKMRMTWREALRALLAAAVENPSKTSVFVKDAEGVLSARELKDVAEDLLSGGSTPNYGLFGFDNDDYEIYADGPAQFADGEWGLEVTHARDRAQNAELTHNPPTVSVERIKGKTGDGWRLSISKPYQHYIDVGLKAAEKEAAALAKQGIYPSNGVGRRDYPEALMKKWAGAKKAAKVESAKTPCCADCAGKLSIKSRMERVFADLYDPEKDTNPAHTGGGLSSRKPAQKLSPQDMLLKALRCPMGQEAKMVFGKPRCVAK
jgi:hypothetical protein